MEVYSGGQNNEKISVSNLSIYSHLLIIVILFLFVGCQYTTEYSKKDILISGYNRDIELAPDYHMTYIYRGNAYYKKDQYDKAIADYNKVIELKPDRSYSYLF